MNALAIGLGATVSGVFIHAILLRHITPKWRLPLLPAILLLALTGIGFLIPLPESPSDAEDWGVALILTLSLGFAYALLLNGVLHDSPTLALVNALDAHGARGMPTGSFAAFVAKHPFVQSRVRALVAARELTIDGEELRLTGNAINLLRVGDAYRRLRGDSNSEAG
jgi:hypothetical protein